MRPLFYKRLNKSLILNPKAQPIQKILRKFKLMKSLKLLNRKKNQTFLLLRKLVDCKVILRDSEKLRNKT